MSMEELLLTCLYHSNYSQFGVRKVQSHPKMLQVEKLYKSYIKSWNLQRIKY